MGAAGFGGARRCDGVAPILRVKDLEVHDDRNRAILSADQLPCPGEILGVAGISGNGQRELAEALLGLRPIYQGQILIDDQASQPSQARSACWMSSVVGIPENPIEEAVVPGLTVLEHMVLGGIEAKRRGHGH